MFTTALVLALATCDQPNLPSLLPYPLPAPGKIHPSPSTAPAPKAEPTQVLPTTPRTHGPTYATQKVVVYEKRYDYRLTTCMEDRSGVYYDYWIPCVIRLYVDLGDLRPGDIQLDKKTGALTLPLLPVKAEPPVLDWGGRTIVMEEVHWLTSWVTFREKREIAYDNLQQTVIAEANNLAIDTSNNKRVAAAMKAWAKGLQEFKDAKSILVVVRP